MQIQADVGGLSTPPGFRPTRLVNRMSAREDAVRAKDEAERFLLRNAVIGRHLNLNKTIANMHEWKFVVKPGPQGDGPRGTRRREQSDEPLLVGRLLGSAEGPWTPVRDIAEREASNLTQAAPSALPNHLAHAPGASASSSNAGLQPAGPQNVTPQAPPILQHLNSMSNSELKTEQEAAEAAVKKISAGLKAKNGPAERLRAELASCQAASDDAAKTAMGFKQILAAQQAYDFFKASLPRTEVVFDLDMAADFAPMFSKTERKMMDEIQRQLQRLGCRSDMTPCEIKETAKSMAKSDRVCRADLAQVQSWLNSVEQRQASLEKELKQCQQRCSRIYQEYLARLSGAAAT
ncbi:hypothetical protein WJX74_002639 [Apatococcus lobatus]|uniref:Uncharacterized protein n=1 Tax=Apatococcus lobatus TaxID=904363 RepID=A0AAW1RP45_9CHLO